MQDSFGLSASTTSELVEAGAINSEPSTYMNKGLLRLRQASNIHVAPDDVIAFNRSQVSSSIDPSKSVLQRQTQLLNHFDNRFDELVRESRNGIINEDNLKRLKTIASDPDFDFFTPFPSAKKSDSYGITPFEKILYFANFDPEQNINREIDTTVVLDAATKERMKGLTVCSSEDLEKSQFEDRTWSLIDTLIVPPYRSHSYAKLTTQIALELLEIANKKGFPKDDHRIPSILFQDFNHNLEILDWFIDRTDLVADISGSKPISLVKLGARLEVLPSINSEEWQEISSEYRKKMYGEIEKYFYRALDSQEKYKNYDAVKLLVHYNNKLPEDLLMNLIQHADSKAYNFKSSYLLCASQDEEKHHNVDKPNLLSLAISPYDDSWALPSTQLVKFLLDHGIKPNEERTVKMTHREEMDFDLGESLGGFSEAIESNDTDALIELLEDKDPSEMMSAFEANLCYIAEFSNYEPEEITDLMRQVMNRRMELAGLMKDYM